MCVPDECARGVIQRNPATGGIDGDSNIFVTYDDELEILGGENDDDVDVILDSDIEDGEFQFDGGGDDEDTLNINLNGDEIDTRGYGRSIDHVEYIDIDAPDGDGEAHLEFLGNGGDQSDTRQVDISDVKDDSSITLDGDLSDQALAGTPTVVNWGDDQASNFIDAAGAGSVDAYIDGFVADHDVEIMMTNEDDTVSLVIGESDLTFTAGAGTTLTLAGAEVGAGAGNNSASFPSASANSSLAQPLAPTKPKASSRLAVSTAISCNGAPRCQM